MFEQPSNCYTTRFPQPPASTDPDELYAILDREAAAYLPETADRTLLYRAYQRAVQAHQGITRDSGEPYVTHPLHVALILAQLQLDVLTLAAALLHDVIEDTDVTYQELQGEFGPEIADLVEGVTKLGQVSKTSRAGQSAANIQKVYLAMSENMRVIFIKLADRLHNLRTLHTKRDPLSRSRSATEALEIYARIADRLGIAILRKEIEDIAFAHLDPEAFERVRLSVEMRYRDNAQMVERIQQEALEALAENGVERAGPGIQPNPRRVYDMYRRMLEEDQDSPLRPKRVPPLLRFHVIVHDVRSCYLAMAAIHSKWTPIASETRDYISAPLSNGYQSLHTTVTIDQHPVKFQIRTTWMHRASQLGIIAYMQEGPGALSPALRWDASPPLKQTVEDLRKFGVEAVEELSGPVEFLTGLKREILGEEIYVYTPKNEVIRLPVGATPVDFAYYIHTDVGHSCRGALVDGHWTPLNRPLRTGERIQILTRDQAGPRYDWLSTDLNYTQSTLAKAKIRRWFRRRPSRLQSQLGRRQFDRVLDRMAIQIDDLSPLLKRLGYQGEEDLYRDIGGCDLAMERVLPELLSVYGETHLPVVCHNETSDIPVTGVGSMGKNLALCCRPHSGDDIVGYILDSRNTVEIHRSDCKVLLDKLEQDQTKLVIVKWGRACETYLACMDIHAHDRPFLLRDVWNIIFDEGINVSDVDVQVNRGEDANVRICIDIEDWLQFHRVMARIEDLPGAIRVRRRPSLDAQPPATERPRASQNSATRRRSRFRVPLLFWLLGGSF
jgi:RelA/SpoT family (p)ppGpp synthetase